MAASSPSTSYFSVKWAWSAGSASPVYRRNRWVGESTMEIGCEPTGLPIRRRAASGGHVGKPRQVDAMPDQPGAELRESLEVCRRHHRHQPLQAAARGPGVEEGHPVRAHPHAERPPRRAPMSRTDTTPPAAAAGSSRASAAAGTARSAAAPPAGPAFPRERRYPPAGRRTPCTAAAGAGTPAARRTAGRGASRPPNRPRPALPPTAPAGAPPRAAKTTRGSAHNGGRTCPIADIGRAERGCILFDALRLACAAPPLSVPVIRDAAGADNFADVPAGPRRRGARPGRGTPVRGRRPG